MRIVAGNLRGRRIDAPEGKTTRPTTDKVREAVFNALGSLSAVDDARVVDLFAGSGALGLEAMSRGAAHCVFIESDRKALVAIRANVEHLGLGESVTVVPGDVMSNLARVEDADIVLADPPYEFLDWQRLLDAVAMKCSKPDVVMVVESDKPLANIEGWEITRSKRYGGTWVTFLQRLP